MLLPLQQSFSRPLAMEDLASSSSTSPGNLLHPMMGQGSFPLVSFPSGGEEIEDDSIFSTDDQTSSQDDQMFLGIRSPSSVAGGHPTRSPDKKEETGEEEDEEDEYEFEDAGDSGQTYQELY